MESMDLICLNLMYKDSQLQKKLAGDMQCSRKVPTNGDKYIVNISMWTAVRNLLQQGQSQQTAVAPSRNQPKTSNKAQSTNRCSNINTDFICDER